jgi:drug/metabolite transporter (DMT)-like permease
VRHLPLFVGSGIVSVLGLSLVYFQCQTECSLAVAGILLYLAPSFVVLMSAALWKAPITRRKVTALVLALAGCGLVSGLVGGELTASPQGLLLGVASGFCYATYTVFAHYALQHYDSLTMTYWTFVFAGLGSLVFWDTQVMMTVFSLAQGIIGALGLAVIATVLPYILYTTGLEGVESGKASIIANVEPVVGALVGVFVFGETLSIWVILGIICVLGGVMLLAKE